MARGYFRRTRRASREHNRSRRSGSRHSAAVATPEVAEAFGQLGFEPFANTPAELAQAVKTENANWAPIVKRVGFTPES